MAMSRANAVSMLHGRYSGLEEETGTTATDDSATGYAIAIDDAFLKMGRDYDSLATSTAQGSEVSGFLALVRYYALRLYRDRLQQSKKYSVGSGVSEGGGTILTQIERNLADAIKECTALGFTVEAQAIGTFSDVSLDIYEPDYTDD